MNNYNYNYKLQYYDLYKKLNTPKTQIHLKDEDLKDKDLKDENLKDEDLENDELLQNIDILYNYDFLQAFNLNDYDLVIIDNIILELFNDLKKNERLKNMMSILSKSFLCEDIDIGFVMMFSFNYFHIIHKIIHSYYTYSGIIDNILLDELENEIKH